MKKIILLLTLLILVNSVYAGDTILTGKEGQTKEFTLDNQTYGIEFTAVGDKRVQLNINKQTLVLDLPSSKNIKINNKEITVHLTNILDKQANLKFEIKETKQENTTNLTLPTTEQTVPGITTVTGTAVKNILNNIKQNKLKYIIGLIVIIIIIYFIYISLEKDPEKQIDKYYRKAEQLHKTAQEYHEDGFPNLAEKSQKKSEKYRQKAREAKINL